jgi:cytidylate kinase
MIIAVDGPTASGKGTIAKALPRISACRISIQACSTARSGGSARSMAAIRTIPSTP